MSRAKSKQNHEVCGDCGALDASWASVNKGILLCTQCCSVHRSLGRHISQVKSIFKCKWYPNQLNMVYALNNNGANNIWEHTLLENGSKLMKKKPTAKDPLSVKQEYIKLKHQQCMFAFRETYEDGLLSVENELGKQLHASVRTPNLETSFRLLALGADPNYFHDEKGTTPLHVATKFEQKLQVELLLVYGADPSCPDSQGKTSIDYARKLTNKEVLNRLIENQYEVTDTFSYYLSMRKPDHNTGVHFYIPQTGFKSNSVSLKKLQKLKNSLFEELTMDVFDEVERRTTEGIWLSCADTTELNDVPFLPVDNTLSTTRNQGRQKLARFSTPEFKSLVYDILIDTQRRQMLSEKGSMLHLREVSVVDDDPLYDSVASDDDYATVPEEEKDQNTDSPKIPSISSTNNNSNKDSIISLDNVSKTNQILEQLTKQLKTSDNTITDLRTEVTKLKQFIKALQTENAELKSKLLSTQSNNMKFTSRLNGDSGFDSLELISEAHNGGDADSTSIMSMNGREVVDEVDLRQRSKQRPSSMYETREGIGKVSNWQAIKNQIKQTDQKSASSSQGLLSSSYFSSAHDREIVLQCTEQITRTIQQLCNSIQEPDKEECVPSAERVKLSIVRLASHLPKEAEAERMKLMLDYVSKLQPECSALQLYQQKGDTKAVEAHFSNIRDIAFQLAKMTKDIVTKYSSNQ